MNPFRAKALAARARYERLTGTTTHDRAMTDAFPLGGGFGRRGGERRLERTIDRAVEAGQALRNARHYEALAAAFEAGTVNAQGRHITPESVERSKRRQVTADRRQAKIAEAKAAIAGKAPCDVPAEVWATAFGYLAGRSRDLVMYEHNERRREAALALNAAAPILAPGRRDDG